MAKEEPAGGNMEANKCMDCNNVYTCNDVTSNQASANQLKPAPDEGTHHPEAKQNPRIIPNITCGDPVIRTCEESLLSSAGQDAAANGGQVEDVRGHGGQVVSDPQDVQLTEAELEDLRDLVSALADEEW